LAPTRFFLQRLLLARINNETFALRLLACELAGAPD
jgi:hypothetical protein